MSDQFFEKPILNSPYEYPNTHWELDESGQPTQKVVNARRRAEFITPIPKPRKRKGPVEQAQMDLGTTIKLIYTPPAGDATLRQLSPTE